MENIKDFLKTGLVVAITMILLVVISPIHMLGINNVDFKSLGLVSVVLFLMIMMMSLLSFGVYTLYKKKQLR